GVYEPPGARGFRGIEHVPRAIDVRLIELPRIPRPEPIIGRNVKDKLASSRGTGQGLRIPQIAIDAFHFQFWNAARRAYQRADAVSAFEENSGDVPAH